MRQKPFGLLFTILLMLPLAGFAQFPGMGHIVYKTMPSSILGQEREYAIYLPKNYDTHTAKRYPVLYLLHGGGGSHTDWPEQGLLQGVANQLIDSNEACEMIIVCPEAGKNFMNYFNSPEWRYEDYFFQELIPYIDSNYRTISNKQNRAIAGLSMGGGGTVAYAFRHPEMFCAAYPMSGYFSRNESLAWVNFDDPVQGKVHQLVEDNNCVKLVLNSTPAQVDAMKTVRWFIDCGDDDFCYDINIDFVAALREKGVPYELRIRDGGHTWIYWNTALYYALPFVTRAFTN
ncbi:MAG: esterase family protein [Tannerellaceae bacterium]|nr:esterase family protein [Tannerellaceae bacterium]